MWIFKLSIFILLNTVTDCLSQNECMRFAIYDTVFMFEGDKKLQIAKLPNNSTRFYIHNQDGSILEKSYCDSSSTLLSSILRNEEGYMHGKFYTFDPLKNLSTYGEMDNGYLLNFSYTIDDYGDTIKFIENVNDTLYKEKKILGDTVLVQEVNEVHNRNGKFQKLHKKTKSTLVEGNYRIIKENEISDYEKFSLCAKRNGVEITFSGASADNMGASIPVGKWSYYSKKGKLLRTKYYDWGDCF